MTAGTVMNIYVKAMNEDDDKEVVAQVCTNIADIVKECGYAAVEPCEKLVLSLTLTRKLW